MSAASDILRALSDTVAVIPEVYDRFKESRRVNNSLVAHDYSAKGIPTDEYFHRLAIAEQAQKGVVPGMLALMLGGMNEYKDFWLGKGIKSSTNDLQNNIDGYIMGRKYRTASALSDALKQYQSESLKDWDKKYNNESLF